MCCNIVMQQPDVLFLSPHVLKECGWVQLLPVLFDNGATITLLEFEMDVRAGGAWRIPQVLICTLLLLAGIFCNNWL